MFIEALAGFGTAAVIVYAMHRRAVRRRVEIIGGVAVMCSIILNNYRDKGLTEGERQLIVDTARKIEKGLRRNNQHTDQHLAAFSRHSLELAEEERELVHGPLVQPSSMQRQIRDKVASMLNRTDQTG